MGSKRLFKICALHHGCLIRAAVLIILHNTVAAPQLINTVPDFQLNQNEFVSRHYHPKVVVQSDGGYVLTWMDERNCDIDVFVQTYDAENNPVGPNQRVNDDESFCPNLNPEIACDSSGDFVVAWTDARHGGFDYFIYGQLFSAAGERIGANVRLCDTNNNKRDVSLAIRSDGLFVICWTEDTGGTFYRVYTKDGQPYGPSKRIKTPNRDRTHGAIVTFIHDKLYLFWQEIPPMPGLWAEQFDNNFDQTDARFNITNYKVEGKEPHVAVANSAYAFVWMGQGHGKRNIYARIFHIDNSPLTTEFMINDPETPSHAWDPDVCAMANDKFIFTWHNARDGSPTIYFKGYNKLGTTIMNESIPVQRSAGDAAMSISVGSNDKEKIVFAWEDNRNIEFEIYAQVYVNNKKQNANFKVNDDMDSGQHYLPRIAKDSDGNLYAMWNFHGNRITLCAFEPDGRIAKRVDVTAFMTPTEANILPHMDVGATSLVVSWEANDDIYAQRFTRDLEPVGSTIRVSQYCGDSNKHSNLSINNLDEFVVSWRTRVDRVYQVVVQKFSATGERIGDRIRLDDSPKERGSRAFMKHTRPLLTDDGGLVVGWLDGRVQSTMRTYFQRVDAEDNLVGGNISVKDSLDHSSFTLALSANNGFIFAWKAKSGGDPRTNNIFVQRFSSIGEKIGAATMVNENHGGLEHWSFPGLSVRDDGSFVLCWEDPYWGDNDILGQLFDANGGKIGPNVRINMDSGPANQTNPNVVCAGDKIVTVWEDNRVAGKGKNIFANIGQFEQPKVTATPCPEHKIHTFQLESNFPNPFNPRTTINYTINTAGQVKLQVFDISGRKVADLVNDMKSPGSYHIQFDAVGLSSGIYFYQLSTATESLTRKMTVMR